MRTTKATIQLDEVEFNSMPGRAEIEKHLAEMPYGVQVVDTDKPYWVNSGDTLVLEIDGEELYRFGGKTIADTLVSIIALVHSTGADEVDTEQKGSKITLRVWWD